MPPAGQQSKFAQDPSWAWKDHGTVQRRHLSCFVPRGPCLTWNGPGIQSGQLRSKRAAFGTHGRSRHRCVQSQHGSPKLPSRSRPNFCRNYLEFGRGDPTLGRKQTRLAEACSNVVDDRLSLLDADPSLSAGTRSIKRSLANKCLRPSNVVRPPARIKLNTDQFFSEARPTLCEAS